MSKKIKWLICSVAFAFGLFYSFKPASAMPLGTLLYRTSWRNNAYGYTSKDLLVIGKKGLITDLYTGHVGIYIGKENGVDYVAEALPSGLVKMPAKYFLNTRAGEKLIGAKIPKNITEEQREKVVALARSLTDAKMKYDFDFKHQKGSESGQWICVGFTEKIYESANTVNPKDLNTLVYNPDEYGIDITPDGFDNTSVYNSQGDCFATGKEFSKISRRPNLLLPAPEIIGYDAGLENGLDRYFFIPQTQFLQPTLEDAAVDIDLESDFDDETIRGKTPQLALIFKWSLINNPSSSLRQLAIRAKDKIASLFKSDTALAVSVENNKATSTKKVAATAKAKTTKTTTTTKAKTAKAATAKTTTTKATSSTKKTSSTPKVSTSTAKVAANKTATTVKKTTSPSVKTASPRLNPTTSTKPVVPIVTPVTNPVVNPTVNNYNTTVVNNTSEVVKLLILIGEVGENWIELYNPNEEAVDLFDGAYRLEKSKTAVDPGIMMRFGNESDGTYPGGTEISGGGSYLIVSDDAPAELKATAQAIASNTNFSWSESGYTIYLGTGAISSNTDSDIMDYVGFGPEAKYYEGSNPASALVANSILIRKANENSTTDSLKSGGSDELLGHAHDTDQNQSDFVLLDLTPPVVIDPGSGDDDDPATSTEIVASSTPKIVLARVYATGDDDRIDLYNDGEIDFDLAANNYRLEKAKTASDPMIVMRIGNENDGTYPGGTIIKSKSYYRLVRNEASEEIKATADAIAIGNNFTFVGSGYTLYLGSDSISAPDDVDIVDMVGFGSDATYHEGAGPAPEILDEGFLSRKVTSTSTAESMAENGPEYGLGAGYDSNDNQADFVVIGGQMGPIGPNSGYGLPGLVHLWHFNECGGNTLKDAVGSNDFDVPVTWRQGKWGCAIEQFYTYPPLQTGLADLKSDGLSIAFNYQNISGIGRTNIALSGPDGGINVVFDPSFTEANGLPTLFRSNDIKWPGDNLWHQGVLVLNGAGDYWELYLDGQRVYQEYFEAIFSKTFNNLEIGDTNGYNYLDEVAIWERALSGEEINNLWLAQSELAPIQLGPEQVAPVEIHHWSFDERSGSTAADDIGGDNFFVSLSQWVRVGHNGAAISHSSAINQKMEINLTPEIRSADLSFDFWWRNRSYPNEARCHLSLFNPNKTFFGLVVSPYRPGYYLNGDYGQISEGDGLTVPSDNAWHHLVLVYDSIDNKVNFYVDGELKYSAFHAALPDEAITKMEIYNGNWEYEIDDLSVWQGALKAAQVKTIYQNETGGN